MTDYHKINLSKFELGLSGEIHLDKTKWQMWEAGEVAKAIKDMVDALYKSRVQPKGGYGGD